MRITDRVRRLEVSRGASRSPAERANQIRRLAEHVVWQIRRFSDEDGTIPLAERRAMPVLDQWAWSLRFDPSPMKLAEVRSDLEKSDHAPR